jgi:predicted CoA-substrate-specific enzyme activase
MKAFKLGIDIGSTTAKAALIGENGSIVYSDYIRHNTQIQETLLGLLDDIYLKLSDIEIQPAFSGSTAMGIAENSGTLFIQEIIAAASLVEKRYPHVKSLIDIGGEDAKLILFNEKRVPDIRMNSNCAGGTGAYIDQMAALLNVSIEELNSQAWQAIKTYPIASRCGVFAKTDVQNLVSRKISTSDIAASIFEAVANQIVNSVARGCTIEPSVLFSGGPLTYISYLREAFCRLLNFDHQSIIVPEHAELFTAVGTALSVSADVKSCRLSEFITKIRQSVHINHDSNTLRPLFSNNDEFAKWEANRQVIEIPEANAQANETCYMGIDVGSTTTKILIINKKSEVLYSFYKNNNGKPHETVIDGLRIFAKQLADRNITVHIGKTAVTGYGEDLIKSGLGMDYGIVETVAHFLAAQKLNPHVSFILDIGGQDIKAIYVQNGVISNIEINEACSSGCGSFIEGFANSLGYSSSDFGNLAVQAKSPFDLGSRCTVFMNSKVKQALRDGATVSDLSAGLAYSVVKNCLNKVLRIKRTSDIGDNIVVQGGIFRNNAVFRSLEILSGKKIVVSDKPELMGAYGAALYAFGKSKTDGQTSSFIGFEELNTTIDYQTKLSTCNGCTNKCQVTTYKFPHGSVCFSGNKCEKIFTNHSVSTIRGQNIFDYKKQLLFNREAEFKPTVPIRIGIPRVLNMYENYPFWHSLFSHCGIPVVLSDESNYSLYRDGIGTLMSDNICFPAKLAHGHIANLVKKKVSRIFLPFVVYEKKEFVQSSNCYNCPIVSGYAEVLKNVTLSASAAGISFDSPTINLNDSHLMKKACWHYLKELGISKSVFSKAFIAAVEEQQSFKNCVRQKNIEILQKSRAGHSPVVLIASHPYHIDQMVHQQVSQILADMGVNVINEDIAFHSAGEGFDSFFTISQWSYPNRILHAVWWASQQSFNLGLIQLNSFGCGPDSFIMDEINELTKRSGISFALVRIDEISSPGSIKLRLRSLVASLLLKEGNELPPKTKDKNEQLPAFTRSDRNRTILVPWFSDFYSPFIPTLGNLFGYKIENLPPSDKQSVDLGLEYSNNEVCYPATLVVGDVLHALKSNKYNLDEIAIGITQTGGQCRATNYISLIKRALINAGYSNIPVISVAPSKSMFNQQPGFNPNWLNAIVPASIALFFIDSISRLYYATASRELIENSTKILKDNYLKLAVDVVDKNRYMELLPLLKEAVNDFNAVPVSDSTIVTVGIVGEIYLKYNSFSQFHIIDWLIKNRVEVVIPPLTEFFTQSFVNKKARIKGNISKANPFDFFNDILQSVANHYINKFENILKGFKFYRSVFDINHSASLASEILDLNHQYGEGWLIPAEIASFVKQGINNVICVQPFGCIANHVVGKGMEMKIKSLYSETNMLYLDFDSGVSELNVINRLHFLIQNVSKNHDSVNAEPVLLR